MFGMGFMEIFLVLIVAIIALGPEKLPGAAVDIVRFFKKFKSGLEDAKSTLDNEMHISELKKETEAFKSSVSNIKNIASIEMDEITTIKDTPQKPSPIEPQEKTTTSENKTTDTQKKGE